MTTISDIIIFVQNKTGAKNVNPDTDIFDDLGCVGDDFDELISEYSKTFRVDLSSYLWYFHSDEEGAMNSIGSHFVKPPYRRVKRIPVTPTLLYKSAVTGSWSIDYPIHKLPKYRYDIWINYLLIIILIFWAIKKCNN
jgi:hypothetical protein